MRYQSYFFCSIIQPILHNVTSPAFYTPKQCLCVSVSSSLSLSYISVTLLPLSPLTKALVVMVAHAHPLVLHLKESQTSNWTFSLPAPHNDRSLPSVQSLKIQYSIHGQSFLVVLLLSKLSCFSSCSTTIE